MILSNALKAHYYNIAFEVQMDRALPYDRKS